MKVDFISINTICLKGFVSDKLFTITYKYFQLFFHCSFEEKSEYDRSKPFYKKGKCMTCNV